MERLGAAHTVPPPLWGAHMTGVEAAPQQIALVLFDGAKRISKLSVILTEQECAFCRVRNTNNDGGCT